MWVVVLDTKTAIVSFLKIILILTASHNGIKNDTMAVLVLNFSMQLQELELWDQLTNYTLIFKKVLLYGLAWIILFLLESYCYIVHGYIIDLYDFKVHNKC